jgi:hypothetical protein
MEITCQEEKKDYQTHKGPTAEAQALLLNSNLFPELNFVEARNG